MNMGKVTVNGKAISEVDGKDLKTNFYANNLGALSSVTMNDDNKATKIVVQMQPGKSMTRKDNDSPYSILNKVLGDHIDNNSKIVKDENDKLRAQSIRLEDTDLYKAFISEDVNGDNFIGENNKLVPREGRANNVQIPSVEVDSKGTKYFTLHGNKEVLYFDSTGKQAAFENGIISGASPLQAQPKPEVNTDLKVQKAPESDKFGDNPQHNDKALNLGYFYVNGKVAENPQNTKGNFYANNINMFANETLNDDSSATRLDVQLNLGATISERDTRASDILKKMLGNNFDTPSKAKLPDTDLYKAFISADVNAANFADNKIVRAEKGFNLVQFPALEADKNGVKYYTLHSADGILYFNDKGEKIDGI